VSGVRHNFKSDNAKTLTRAKTLLTNLVIKKKRRA